MDKVQDPSLEGEKALKDLENKIRENLRAEYARKEQEKEKELGDKLAKYESRIAELDEKVKLSEAEKEEKRRLEDKVDKVEERIYELDHSPEYKPFRSVLDRQKKEVAKLMEEYGEKLYSRVMSDLVDDRLLEPAKKLNIEPKKLREELNKRLRLEHQNLSPLERARITLEEHMNSVSLSEKESEAAKKAAEEKAFMERNGRSAVPETLEQAKEKGDLLSQMKLLGVHSGKPPKQE